MKAFVKTFTEKLLAFLRVRAASAGLEVSDEVVRLAHFDGKAWQLNAVRLEPGVLVGGKIQDRDRFVAALAALRERAQNRRRRAGMNVVLCMSSLPAYMQVFALPAVSGKEFDEAVELNLKMASPLEAGKAYFGWQVVGRDEETLQSQVLSAFMDREAVDGIVHVLFDAGFIVTAAESHALSLVRALRERGAGVDAAKPYIFVDIDNTGLDFIIIRSGAPYFEYEEAWRDVADEKGEIAIPRFNETLAASVRQVVNFYRQHWQEPLGAIILSAVALEAEAEAVIAAVVDAPVVRLSLVTGLAVSSEWLAALGASLRGQHLKAKGREINLLGEESQDRYREAQATGFLQFWRIVVPAVLGLLVVTFVVADAFLMNTKEAIESRSDFNIGAAQMAEVSSLESSSADFNQMVALVAVAEQATSPKSALLSAVTGIAAASHVTVSHVTFQSFNAPVVLSGSGASQDDVIAFKAALGADPRFSGVNLPLTAIQTAGGTVSFSVTFTYSPP